MHIFRRSWYFLSLASAFYTPANAVASDVIDKADKVECFQHGKLVYSTTQQIRDFTTQDDFELLAQLNLGPISQTLTRFYADKSGNFVCLVTSRN